MIKTELMFKCPYCDKSYPQRYYAEICAKECSGRMEVITVKVDMCDRCNKLIEKCKCENQNYGEYLSVKKEQEKLKKLSETTKQQRLI